MIIVIFLVCVGFLILGLWMINRDEDNGFGWVSAFFGGFAGCASFVALICLLVTVSELTAIQPKIEMYQTENTNIENQIAECVREYQKYETEIFTDVAPDSAITLVSLYPELKSDELVKKQIEVYLANNQKIKELKEQDIMGDVYRWWTYFGG